MSRKTKRDTELLKFMDRVPPCLVRFMAVVKVEPNPRTGNRSRRCKLVKDIAADSGLNRRTVQRIAAMKTWANVDIGEADKFLKGCNVDILHRDDIRRFIRSYAQKDFQHLTDCERARLYQLMNWV